MRNLLKEHPRQYSYHKSGFTNGWLCVWNSQEDGDSSFDLVDVGNARSIEFGHAGSVVQVDEEPVDPAVVGVDRDVTTEVLAARTTLALK